MGFERIVITNSARDSPYRALRWILSALILALPELTSFPIEADTQDMDCSLLDPRSSISKEGEGKVNLAASALLKVGKAEGTIDGRVKEVITPYVEANATEFDRVLYVFCGMIGKAKDISSS